MDERPNLTFNDLIRLALLSKPKGRATLAQIYDFIEQSYPYYKSATECRFWKNSIRHNLCKNRQFRKLTEANLDDENDKPYKRGSAVWELCDMGLVTQGGSGKKLRPLKKKSTPSKEVSSRTRPGSADSTCTDMSSLVYNHPYPWQQLPVEPSQSHPAVDLSGTDSLTAISDSWSPALAPEAYFKPWTTSPVRSPSSPSHLEAPRLEELGSPPVGAWSDPSPPRPAWSLGQGHSIGGGVREPAGGAWSNSTTEALRAASPASILADTALSTNHPGCCDTPPNQYTYTDGLFWYSWYSL